MAALATERVCAGLAGAAASSLGAVGDGAGADAAAALASAVTTGSELEEMSEPSGRTETVFTRFGAGNGEGAAGGAAVEPTDVSEMLRVGWTDEGGTAGEGGAVSAAGAADADATMIGAGAGGGDTGAAAATGAGAAGAADTALAVACCRSTGCSSRSLSLTGVVLFP